MSCGIYRITNKTNGKSYVGQSTNIERRWSQHRNADLDSAIKRAFIKDGLENFSFEILEECHKEDLNDRELYFIEKLNTCYSGYNKTLGGSGSKTLPDTDILMIKRVLIETDLSTDKIGNLFRVSGRQVRSINAGESWFSSEESYPLRTKKTQTFNCIDCNLEIVKGALRCLECSSLKQRKADRPSAEQLKKDIQDSNFKQVGVKYGVSDNAIRKWCVSYGMSKYARDYK